MTGTVTRLQTRARIRSDFLAQSPADHRALVDERARLHEGEFQGRSPERAEMNADAATICVVALIGILGGTAIGQGISQFVEWVSG